MQIITPMDGQSVEPRFLAAEPTTSPTNESAAEIMPVPTVEPEELDSREQLFNGGETGPIDHIQVSTERIVRLNAILFDIDPANLRSTPLVSDLSQNPDEFYERCVQRLVSKPSAAGQCRGTCHRHRAARNLVARAAD